MSKNKKIVIMISIIIIIVIIVTGVVCYFLRNKNNNNPSSKISKLYEKLKSDNSYTFTQTLDDENKMYYAKKEGKAYIDIFEDGQENKTIVTEGNTYLVNDDEKTYYIYNNNETDFNKIENQLSELKDMENKKGKEKIGNTTYYYEEYDSITEFIIQNSFYNIEENKPKTRFYFDGDELKYIKTIINNKQELTKIDISNKVDNKLFEISSDYQKK